MYAKIVPLLQIASKTKPAHGGPELRTLLKEAGLRQVNTDSPVLIPTTRQQIRRPEVLDRVCSCHDAVTASNIGSTGIVVPSAYVPIARTGLVQSMP